MKDFGIIDAPLTKLLLKNSFNWDVAAAHAFDRLKNAMISTLVLAIPNFSKVFVVECDASETRLGAV